VIHGQDGFALELAADDGLHYVIGGCVNAVGLSNRQLRERPEEMGRVKKSGFEEKQDQPATRLIKYHDASGRENRPRQGK